LFPAHGACAERPGATSQTCPKTVRSACADPAQGGHFSRAQMQMNRLEFRILGPLTVWVDGVSVPIGGPKQRALLAMLLMSANRVVSRERRRPSTQLNVRPSVLLRRGRGRGPAAPTRPPSVFRLRACPVERLPRRRQAKARVHSNAAGSPP